MSALELVATVDPPRYETRPTRHEFRPIAGPPRRLPPAPSRPGLRCPYCRKVTASPVGGRFYQCQNADCPGGPESLMKHTSLLVIDAAHGVRLVTFREARALQNARITDPLAGVRRRYV